MRNLRKTAETGRIQKPLTYPQADRDLRGPRFQIMKTLLLPLFFLAALLHADKRSNVLLVMVDDMGWSDLGCYGGEIDTPNVDSLAAGGLRFTRFYNNSVCGPTRASLLSGLYCQQTGHRGNSWNHPRITARRRIPHRHGRQVARTRPRGEARIQPFLRS